VHVVTKILVVLATILSILLAAMSVAFTANADRVRSEIERLRTMEDAQSRTLQAKEAASGAARDRLEDRIAELNDELARVSREMLALQQDNARLMADAEGARAEAAAVQAKIDQLASTVATQSELISSYRSEVTSLRDKELRYARREIELSDRISELAGQLEVAQETNRALQERLAEAQFAEGRPGGRVAAGATGSASGPVRAQITELRRDPSTGSTLASIDAGANDRLRRNMELSIVRGNEFIGKLTLETVDLNESVGRVDLLGNRQATVRPGDLVVTSLR